MVLYELDRFVLNRPFEFPIALLFHVIFKTALYVFLILNGCLGLDIIYRNGKGNIRLITIDR